MFFFIGRITLGVLFCIRSINFVVYMNHLDHILYIDLVSKIQKDCVLVVILLSCIEILQYFIN